MKNLIEKIENNVDLKNIYNKLLDYLSKRNYSEEKLIQKIINLKKYYPHSQRYQNYNRENTKIAISLIKEYGFLNEKEYARNLLNYLINKKDGLKRIRQKMLNRLIKKDIVKKTISEFRKKFKQDLTRIIELTKLKREQLQKKYKNDWKKTSQINNKLYLFLQQKGYNGDEITEVLNAECKKM
ncbi:RecX family transcriptional regulator [Candidatus Kuenenbacteria bacterium]|nr:RecX family transcriptional regulator [Candidatus Kuenenbacteria bacterium]